MGSGSTWRGSVVDFTYIIIGCILFAVGVDVFLVPNGLAAGGIFYGCADRHIMLQESPAVF